MITSAVEELNARGIKNYAFVGTKRFEILKENFVPTKIVPLREYEEINNKMRQILGDRFIDMSNLLCPMSPCDLYDSGKSLTFDGSHLTKQGARKISKGLYVAINYYTTF